MRVIGIDVSLAACGVGIIDWAGPAPEARAEVVITKGRRADDLRRRDARIAGITDDVLRHAECRPPDTLLAVIEGASYGSAGAGAWDRAGLWWRIVERLHAVAIPVAMVAPATLKKWAAGSGRADKADVAVAMSRLWPGVDVGAGNDGWDALALAHMGAQRLGWAVPSRAHHAASLAKATWPDFPAPAVAS